MGEEKKNQLARKYRPQTLEQFIGEDIVVKVRNRCSDLATLPHLILVHGTRGCGKTTIGRLIAKRLQCLNPKENGDPCESCTMCKAINEACIKQGEEISGLQIIDIATDSGKANLEGILETAKLPPMYPVKFKILLLDEIHMASTAAQNCLLKITEEPPEHLIIILCTTQPNALLDTLKSRCTMKIPVFPLQTTQTVKLLQDIAIQEGYTVSEQALALIAQHTGNIPRESINLLEDIALSNKNKVDIEKVMDTLKVISPETYLHFFSMQNKKMSDIILYVAELERHHIQVTDFVDGLTRFVLDAIYMKNGTNLDTYSETYATSISKVFKDYTEQELAYILQAIEDTYFKVRTVSSTAMLEVLILNLCIKLNKLHIYELDLKHEQDKTDRESTMANKAYNQHEEAEKKQKQQSNKTNIHLDNRTFADIFGNNLQQVNVDINLDTPVTTTSSTAEKIKEFEKYT